MEVLDHFASFYKLKIDNHIYELINIDTLIVNNNEYAVMVEYNKQRDPNFKHFIFELAYALNCSYLMFFRYNSDSNIISYVSSDHEFETLFESYLKKKTSITIN